MTRSLVVITLAASMIAAAAVAQPLQVVPCTGTFAAYRVCIVAAAPVIPTGPCGKLAFSRACATAHFLTGHP